jgi:hypothetical protein
MSLISHLIVGHTPSAENAAVEAVGYVLRGSDVAAGAMARLLRSAERELPERLRFSTQASEENGGRPDLEGETEAGEKVALIEAKFWAGLTDQQPTFYLKRFKAGRPSVLAFLVPAKRFRMIWPEIQGRCKDAGMPCGPTTQAADEFWHARLAGDNQGGHHLAIMSWRLVIDVLAGALTQAGQMKNAADLDQIRDLCDQMDDEAFLPFTAEELSSHIVPRRQAQLFALAAELGSAAISEGIGGIKDRKGGSLQTPRSLGSVGRYMRLGGTADVSVGYENARWGKFGISPLWVRFPGFDKVGQALARQRLSARRYDTPPRYFEVDGEPCIPLRLPAGREKSQILRAALNQLQEISDRLIEAVSEAETATEVAE